jgi:hypothetical protein
MNLRWLSFGLALGLLASSAVSCGGAKQCSAANCPFGCCDSAGTCQSTVSNAQCGTNGTACMACPLGTNCSLGVCTAVGGTGGSGGGSSGTGGGSSGTGGGGGTTGGGGGTTGGGSGGGSGSAVCTALGSANSSFFGTRSSCAFELTGVGQVSIDNNPDIVADCNAALGQCTTNDRTILSNLASCIAAAPSCTAGNENAAGNSYFACMNDATGLSSGCQNAINPGTGGGGGATGGGGGSVTGGGGGSVTGGGGGTTGGGGGSTTCRVVSGFASGATASYTTANGYEFTAGSIDNGTAAPVDALAIEVIWAINGTGTGITVPGTYDLATQGTYASCKACVALCEGCSPGGTNCTKCYLARSGSMNIQQAPRAATGTFQATVSNVRAEAWNLGGDQPLNDGTCVTISSASINTAIAP